MRPLISLSSLFGATPKRKAKRKTAKKTPKRPAAKRSARKKQSFGKWLQGRKRSFKILRQNLAPYAVVMSLAFVCLILAVLWASGVFGQMREEINRFSMDLFAESKFSIQHVTVEGRGYTDKTALNAALNAERGQSLLHFDVNAARDRLQTLEWVSEASVLRLWPNALHLVLVESRPAAIWQLNGKLQLIDRQGHVISDNHIAQFGNLPHVVGKGANYKAAELTELLAQYPLIRARVRAAVRIGERRWNLRLDSGVDVQLPDTNEERALKRLLVLEEEHRLFARDISIIDLRDHDRLYVRLNSDKVLQFNGPGLDT